MVGGSTRTPYIKSSVSSFFGREVYDKINPDEVVALGAAIQADVLAGNQKRCPVRSMSHHYPSVSKLLEV